MQPANNSQQDDISHGINKEKLKLDLAKNAAESARNSVRHQSISSARQI